MNKKRTVNKTAFRTLLIGSILTFAVPFIVPFLNLDFLKDSGAIGDTIGGITSPISQLVGSILLFLALKAQLDANTIIQLQIEKDNDERVALRELEQLHELYLFFENNIKEFSYDFIDNTKANQKQLLYGRRAIKSFIADIEKMNVDIHNDANVLEYDGVREVLSILKSAGLIFDKIKHSTISQKDKLFYNTILKHELLFSIFPTTDLDENSNLKLPECPVCHENHGYFPPIIFDRIQELKSHFMDDGE